MSPSFPPLPHDRHLAAVRERASLASGDALLVTDLVNIRYLTGFTGSAALLLVAADGATLVTDERYGEQAAAQSGAYAEVVAAAPAEQLGVLARSGGAALRTLYFDPEQVSVDLHDRLSAAFEPASLQRRTGVVELARRVKGDAEIARMRAAARIAVAAHARVLDSLGDEPTEAELAHRFAEAVRDLGADDIAFSTIVAAGARASMPHAVPTEQRVRAGDLLLMDFGAMVDGYLSDVTRTVVVGGGSSADVEAERLIATVTEAHDAGIALAAPGVTHAAVDAECRRMLRDRGYDEGPTHPFGHQLGLRIHERPFLTSTATEAFEPGNVVTVEPGVYLPGRIGCRVEDTILITADGSEVLSTAAQ